MDTMEQEIRQLKFQIEQQSRALEALQRSATDNYGRLRRDYDHLYRHMFLLFFSGMASWSFFIIVVVTTR